jgi:hypothetical protein
VTSFLTAKTPRTPSFQGRERSFSPYRLQSLNVKRDYLLLKETLLPWRSWRLGGKNGLE